MRAGRLAIISVPFVRLARVTLSDLVLGALRKVGDVVIVSPFADQPSFRKQFAGPRTAFLRWPAVEHQGLTGRMLAASELMRMNGYWLRHREHGMAYYLENSLTVPGRDGQDTRISGARGMYYRLLSAIGRFAPAWRLTERVAGSQWYQNDELTALARHYDEVTLLQSANWGNQDRALARLSRDHGWRTVLVPYTTDQLDMNGYLVSDFDVVCPQGPFEYDRAVQLHGVAASRLNELGSAWLRHLAMIRRQVAAVGAPSRKPFVMYAGVSALYFPRASELAAVRAVAEQLVRLESPLPLVYRPVEDEPAARQEIERFCATLPSLSIDWPAASELGLHEYPDADLTALLRRHVEGLAGCRLMIMSNTTSLLIDVALLERSGIIINRADPTGVLARRKLDLLQLPWLAKVPMAHNLDELLDAVTAFFADPAAGQRVADEIVAAWEYPHDEFETRLLSAVFGDNGSARRAR